jgi:hypothetical protein
VIELRSDATRGEARNGESDVGTDVAICRWQAEGIVAWVDSLEHQLGGEEAAGDNYVQVQVDPNERKRSDLVCWHLAAAC